MANEVTAEMPTDLPTPMNEVEAVEKMAAFLENELKEEEIPQEADKPVEAEVKEPEEVTLEAEEEDVETEAQAEEEVESEQEPEDEVDEAPVISSLEELAEATDKSIDDVMENLLVDVKVNGETSRVSIGEAIKGYQRESDYSRRVNEVEDQRKTLIKAQESADNASNVIELMYQADMEMLEQQKSMIPWDQLRQSDPAEWAAKNQEFQQYEAMIGQKYQNAYQQVEANKTARQEQNMQQLRELTAQGFQALKEQIPEWRDEANQVKDISDIRDYLAGIGYSPEEMQGIVDPRIIRVARDAMMGHRVKSAIPGDDKRTKRKVKILKAGARQKPESINLTKAKKLEQRARKTQSDEAWAEALMAKMNL